MKSLNKTTLLVGSLLFVMACAQMQKAAVYVGEVTGNETLVKASADMTPQQEYYLGRSITARVLTEKTPVTNEEMQSYVNYIGQYLSYHCELPELFQGYRFVVVEDNVPMAMSAPGGFVIISKGMLDFVQNEDELAAVLAHEVAHIAVKHAEKNIKSSNKMAFGQDILARAGQEPSGKDLKVFGDAIKKGRDIIYSKDQEMEADKTAVEILQRAGYDPGALYRVLSRLPASAGIFSKHPRNEARLKQISGARRGLASVSEAREKRFARLAR